jgi:hypothetical protein
MCCNLACGLKAFNDDVTVVSFFDATNALSDKLNKAGVKLICLGKKSA